MPNYKDNQRPTQRPPTLDEYAVAKKLAAEEELKNYRIRYFIPDAARHDCRFCGTNLDVYSTRLEVDHARPEFYDVRCQRCGSVTTIEDLTNSTGIGKV